MLIPVTVLMTAELPLISLPFFFVPSFAIDGSTSIQVEPSASMQFQVDANEVQRHYNSKVSPMETFCTIPTGSHNAANNHLPSGTGNAVYDPQWMQWKLIKYSLLGEASGEAPLT